MMLVPLSNQIETSPALSRQKKGPHGAGPSYGGIVCARQSAFMA
jgi:hypothetical protein